MDHLLNFHFNILQGKINGCPKSIDLGNIFKNFGWEKKRKEKKKKRFFNGFLHFP